MLHKYSSMRAIYYRDYLETSVDRYHTIIIKQAIYIKKINHYSVPWGSGQTLILFVTRYIIWLEQVIN